MLPKDIEQQGELRNDGDLVGFLLTLKRLLIVVKLVGEDIQNRRGSVCVRVIITLVVVEVVGAGFGVGERRVVSRGCGAGRSGRGSGEKKRSGGWVMDGFDL